MICDDCTTPFADLFNQIEEIREIFMILRNLLQKSSWCNKFDSLTITAYNEFPKILLLSEIYWRPIGDLQETHRKIDMPAESNRNFNVFKYSFFNIHTLCLFTYIEIIYRGLSVSDGSPIGLRWVSDQACWSPIIIIIS